jgi:hypothetical protein
MISFPDLPFTNNEREKASDRPTMPPPRNKRKRPTGSKSTQSKRTRHEPSTMTQPRQTRAMKKQAEKRPTAEEPLSTPTESTPSERGPQGRQRIAAPEQHSPSYTPTVRPPGALEEQGPSSEHGLRRREISVDSNHRRHTRRDTSVDSISSNSNHRRHTRRETSVDSIPSNHHRHTRRETSADSIPSNHRRHTRRETSVDSIPSNHRRHTHRETSVDSIPSNHIRHTRRETSVGSLPFNHRRQTHRRSPEMLPPPNEVLSDREARPIRPAAIRPAQPRTAPQSSLCWEYFQKLVVGKRRTKKGTEVDDILARCKLCPVKYIPLIIPLHPR